VNITDRAGWMPLHVAIYMRRQEVTQVLIDWGADMNATFGEACHTAMHVACHQSISAIHAALYMRWSHQETSLKIVRLLLQMGIGAINIDKVDSNGRSPIDYCAYFGRSACLEVLLAAGGDPCSNKCSSLLYALCRGHGKCVQLLIDSSPNILDRAFNEQIVNIYLELRKNRRSILIAAHSSFTCCLFSVLKLSSAFCTKRDLSHWGRHM